MVDRSLTSKAVLGSKVLAKFYVPSNITLWYLRKEMGLLLSTQTSCHGDQKPIYMELQRGSWMWSLKHNNFLNWQRYEQVITLKSSVFIPVQI